MIKLKAVLHGIASDILYKRARAKVQLQEAVAQIKEHRAKHVAFVHYVKAVVQIIATFGKDLQDSVGLADSGFITTQDYAHYSYFAEDYVVTKIREF
jgi:hypothetical protein